MAEYRALRAKHTLLELCQTPELATQITLQPVEKLGVDAAILFADLLLPAQAMGMDLAFVEGEGPVLGPPIRSEEAIRALHEPAGGELDYVADTVRLVCGELNGRLPVIGFSGAPFTLASYMIEGGATRDFLQTKQFMYRAPELWKQLMEKIVSVLAVYLRSQAAAGAAALQVFDSWVGCLSPADYRRFVLPHSQKLLRSVSGLGVPLIHFGTGTSTLLEQMREAGGDVIGVDWRAEIGEAWQRIGSGAAIQGNLDPILLFAPREILQERVEEILRSVDGRAGHIFNLGHGILPRTPVETVQAVVEMIHNFPVRSAGH